MSQFWSKRTQALSPYVPGEQPKDTRYIKLNTNENPYPPSATVQQAIQAASGDLLRLYPDPNADELKQAIADFYQVDRKNVFVGNGSDEVLAHAFVALLKHDKPLLYPDISYSFYPVYSKLFGMNEKQIPLDHDFAINFDDYQQENGGIIFPNPNAPTGKAVTLHAIEKLVQQHPHSVIAVDEAYVDFGAESAIPLTKKYDNLLVIQTFSKSRSLAGLRVGFAIGSVALIEGLERVKNSFNSYPLGREAIAGATASINDSQYFEISRQKIIQSRTWTHEQLTTLGFSILPSHANFVFAKPPTGYTAEILYQQLKAKNILVRYFNNARIDEYLRITIGTQDEMQTFIKTLADIFE
jgi:histidinol-phosphate aminotransferase